MPLVDDYSTDDILEMSGFWLGNGNDKSYGDDDSSDDD